ncbi:subunit ChlI of Mg-chelatase family protein [Mycobacterium xenopi 3993]|nr:subunit ChlI of Mg-chelatase family protein [Mycobacterium xenopi 3993]
MSRLTLALSPATLPKMGSVYDLALAAAVLSAQRRKPWRRLQTTVLLGNWLSTGECAQCAGAAGSGGRQGRWLVGRRSAGRQPGGGQPG